MCHITAGMSLKVFLHVSIKVNIVDTDTVKGMNESIFTYCI